MGTLNQIVGSCRQLARELAALPGVQVPNRVHAAGGPDDVAPPGEKTARPLSAGKAKVFVVHGRDEALKNELQVYLNELGVEPIVLHRKPDQGKTIIEKFEHYSDVRFAFILLTPDDVVCGTSSEVELSKSVEYRARQNVVWEFGFFVAKLGRDRTCIIFRRGVTKPSDIDGLLYKEVKTTIEALGFELLRELVAAGVPVKVSSD